MTPAAKIRAVAVPAVDIAPVADAGEVEVVRALFLEYAAGLGFSLCFQGFDQELASLPGAYGAPAGELLLARRGAEAAGCVGLRPFDEARCEMKRLYVRPPFRGQRLGARLAEAAIAAARRAGYRRILLDTLPEMREAQQLYRRLGFRQIAPYYDNPIPGAAYYELELRAPAATEAPGAIAG